MSISENEIDQFWDQSNASKFSSNFFSDVQDNEFGLFDPSERIFFEETNTIESFTEKPQNFKSISTHSNLKLYESAESTRCALYKVDQQKYDFDKRKLHDISPRGTVLRMVLGESYCLEIYKSKEDKLSLLDEALSSCDGNAILITILFLERTMKLSLFTLEMAKRSTAVDHYITFLQSETISTKLSDALGMFQKNERVALLKFKWANNSSSKINLLRKCLKSHFELETDLQFESSILRSYIDLLELQMPIQEHDEKDHVRGTNPILKELPPSVSLVGTSALSTLYYSCLYHYDKLENFLGSPSMVKKSQKLTEKQFIWIAARALARLKRWDQLEPLFVTKSWIGLKIKSPIPFDRVVSLLQHLSAPKEIKEKYCMLITDTDYRIEIAEEHSCHSVVLQTYKDRRDREMIEKYRINLKSKTPEDYLASEILNDKTIKWKN